ncbi:hypothetical protein [Streptomyces sp. UNOC14_S4]|nr:hypothetical protein [Streptomyces sp. UNOC14_S4]
MPQEMAAAGAVATTATPPARNTYIVVAVIAYTLDAFSSTPV